MDWATTTNVLLTLLDWKDQDTLPVTLSQIRSASEELLEAMGDLQDDIKELTLDLQERDKQLAEATATIKRLQERPRGRATTGQAYHQFQYEARRTTGACTRCGSTGHFHATCPQRNPLTPGPSKGATLTTDTEPKTRAPPTPTESPTTTEIKSRTTPTPPTNTLMPRLRAAPTSTTDQQQGGYRRHTEPFTTEQQDEPQTTTLTLTLSALALSAMEESRLDGNHIVIRCSLGKEPHDITEQALCDTGATGFAFIDEAIARQHNFPKFE